MNKHTPATPGTHADAPTAPHADAQSGNAARPVPQTTAGSLAQWIPLQQRSDARGSLAIAEGNAHIPFAIARVYYLYGAAPGTERGFHAHRALDQVAVCVAGSCNMIFDDGRRREQVTLDNPARAVRIPPLLWHEMRDFSADCVLLVFAAAPYEEADYIRDYDAFKAHVQASQF